MPVPIIPTQPPVSTPSGEIQSFTITDTLVPFKTGSTIKWLVNGTNSLTVVTLNGVKIGLYGVLETGPLKQNTMYTLAVNSGKKDSITLKVADSIISLLWGGGKALKQIKAEVYIVPQGQTNRTWVDTSISARDADQRIYFTIDGNSKILHSIPIFSVTDGGKVVTDLVNSSFVWQGVLYVLETLDSKNLVVQYVEKQANGMDLTRRNTYAFE
ncbi:MAG: hypothetical protein V4450_04715 [Bacteroidota bacterium]